jgi:meckelin
MDFIVILGLLLFYFSSLVSAATISFLSSCPSFPASRYDISSINCELCSSGQIVSVTSSQQCQCAKGYYSSIIANPYSFICSPCANFSASLVDGTKCLPCDGATFAVYDNTRQDCSCPANYKLIEYDTAGNVLPAKQCIACPSNSVVLSSNSYQCKTCPDKNMTIQSSGTCVCGGTAVAEPSINPQFCLPGSTVNSLVTTDMYKISYWDLRSDDSGEASAASYTSYPFVYYYRYSAVQCLLQQNRTACQILANLCVLQKYYSNSAACQEFNNIATPLAPSSRGFGQSGIAYGWHDSLPLLYFTDSSVLSAADLKSVYVLSDPDPGQSRETTGRLLFQLAKYTLNGTFLGFTQLSTELQLCSGDPEIMVNYLRFGTNYENSCIIDLNKLLLRETLFYDLYIQDTSSTIYPVPVKILNLRSESGQRVNEGGDPRLTHRFFVVDTVSGKSTDTSKPATLVYAKSITLEIQMQSGSNANIYPPLLTIEYSERLLADIEAGSFSSAVTFAGHYKGDTSGAVNAGIALFSLSIVFGLAWAIRRLCVWQRKNHGDIVEINLMLLVRVVVYLFSALGTFFFISITAIAFYCFLFYKGQQTVYFLLPEVHSSESQLLGSMIIVCFVSKLVEVLYSVYQQIGQDIFFIDWEKPLSSHLHQDEETGRHVNNSVSVWRKILAANKLNDLQSARIISVPFTLFFMIFLTRALNLEFLATAQPTFTLDSTAAPVHPILLYAVTTFFLLLILGIQFIFRKQIFHRYFKDPAAQFVDLLSTSNISCLMFSERYHAYYLHGKTVHSHADVSMEQMNQQIQAESKTWTKERGLIPGKDTFELYCSTEFKAHYDSEYTALLNRQLINRQRLAGNSTNIRSTAAEELRSRSGGDLELDNQIAERLIKANASLNAFLCSFIDRNLPAYPYDFSEQSYWRKLLQLPVFIPQASSNLFFDDADFLFTRTTLMGIEWDLSMMLILLYSLCDYAFSNQLVAVLVCYLVDLAIVAIRGYYGRINISRKSLIDERFLI